MQLAIGPELAVMLEARRWVLARASDVSTLASAEGPKGGPGPSPSLTVRAYLLELADGTRLKGRRFADPQRAHEVQLLLEQLMRAGHGVAELIEARGGAMLLRWVEGPTLAAPATWSGAHLARCGQWLGALHMLPAPEVLANAASVAPGALLERLERQCATLVRGGALDATLAQGLVARAYDQAPSVVAVGIAHGDFCGDNLVVQDGGRIVSIDNANLHVGSLDLDLGRTFARWPLSEGQRQELLGGYATHRPVSAFRAGHDFWMIAALVGSADTRFRLKTRGLDVPLAQLARHVQP